MRRKHIKRRTIILFLEVLALVVVAGLGIVLYVAQSKGLIEHDSTSDTVKAEIINIDKIKGSNVDEAAKDRNNLDEIDSRYGDLLKDAQLCTRDHIYPKETMAPDKVTMLFAGDVGLQEGYAVLESLKNRGGDISAAFDNNTLEVMKNADIFMVNNEFTYTTGGVPTEGKQYTFRTNPDNVRYLFDMGVDIVSLANNHVYDYGEVSLTDTLDTLEAVEMPYVGAGRNISEAIKPTYFIANDMRIAIVNATQIERSDNPDTKGATDNSPGTFRCWYDDKVCDVISEAAACSDYVVAYIHWGTELQVETDWAQDELAHKLSNAGADIIIGDHPHILQRMDYCDNVPIIYSLGNYWFNSKTIDTGLLEVTLYTDSKTPSLRFIPAIQCDSRVNIATEGEKNRILDYMRSISPNVLIDSDGVITSK